MKEVRVTEAVHNFFRLSVGHEVSHYPRCYLLGMNSKRVVSDLETLGRFYDGCEEMPNISATKLSGATLKLIKRNKTPCGIARISDNIDFNMSPINSNRGNSLKEIGAMNPRAFIITVVQKGLKVESYNPKTRKVRKHKYSVVKGGDKEWQKPLRSKSRKSQNKLRR